MMKAFRADLLQVEVYETREEMGANAAKEAAVCINEMLKSQDEVNIIFAAAPSQNDFLKALRVDPTVDWHHVNAFHMDEYIGLSEFAPQLFGNFLREAIFNHLPFKEVFYLYSGSLTPEENCVRYQSWLDIYPPDIVFMGIGENGHIAFNDPHVARFDDPTPIKVVDLDLKSREQQVHDGCFYTIEDVPSHAVTLTIPALMSARRIFCMVPTSLKADAVKATVEGEISEVCPASILRRHPNATLYCDKQSAGKLEL